MILESDRKLLFTFIEGVTGNSHDVDFRSEVIINNVSRLIEKSNCQNMWQYLSLLGYSNDALSSFIKETTIHTTRWFRENKHLQLLERDVIARLEENSNRPVHFKAASFGCSSGQEVYSMAMVLEKYRKLHKSFDYKIYGYDVDVASVEQARRAIYKASELCNIPEEYLAMVWLGQDSSQGLFTLDKEIRGRCVFKSENLLNADICINPHSLNAVFIRNILIYFSNENANKIIDMACFYLAMGGGLYLGHSESHLVPDYLPLKPVSPNVFEKQKPCRPESKLNKVLVVEDSITVQFVLKKLLQDAGFEVDCVSCKDSLEKYIKEYSAPDIISLDLHMPQFNGEKWLETFRIRNRTTPVVIISSLFPEDANPVMRMLSSVAVDYIEKKQLSTDPELVAQRFKSLIFNKSYNSCITTPNDLRNVEMSPKLILIGASTGGVKAIKDVLKGLPSSLPPVVIVQHISSQFADELANCLGRLTGLKIGSATTTTLLKNGHFYIAADDSHLTVKSSEDGLYVVPTQHPNHQFMPSVDVLFSSVEKDLCKDTVSILLSGMGCDGVTGMGRLFEDGALTIAQSKKTAAVFGMPGEAIKSGFARHISDPADIRKFLLRTVTA